MRPVTDAEPNMGMGAEAKTFTVVHRLVDLCMILRVISELGCVHINRPSSQAFVSLKQHEHAGHRVTPI